MDKKQIFPREVIPIAIPVDLRKYWQQERGVDLTALIVKLLEEERQRCEAAPSS